MVDFLTSSLLRAQNMTLLSKVRRRFCQILWPSQKNQTLTSRFFSKLISRVKQGGSVAERAAHIVNFLRLSTFLQPISRMHSWKENASFSHMLIRIGAAATYTTYLPTYYYILLCMQPLCTFSIYCLYY